MNIIKKLTFAPLFLISFGILIYQFPQFLKSYDFIFSLSIDTLIQLIAFSALISLSSFLFILFSTLALDWKFILPVGILSSLIPFVILETGLALVFSVGTLISLLLTFLNLDGALKSYLTFKPEVLFGPSLRHLSSLLILAFCLVYFLSANKMIAQNGFQIPDSLIDTALNLSQPASSKQETNTPQFSIPKEQLDLLRKNPELLKQSGLDPKILDTLTQPQKSSETPQDLTNNLIKSAVKDQIQNFIKPYLGFIPAILAVLLFFTLQSLTSIVNLLIYPLLWITFFILEKTGFVRFEIEQRPVKKLII